MNELHIASILGKNKFTQDWFRGTYARDEVADVKIQPRSIYVFNFSVRSEKGTHWSCLVLTLNGFPIYFDPGGEPPPLYFEEFHSLFDKFPLCVYSALKIQHDSSKSCGLYCCLVAARLARGLTLLEARAPFGGTNLLKNELILEGEFRKEFGRELFRAQNDGTNIGLVSDRYRRTMLPDTGRKQTTFNRKSRIRKNGHDKTNGET